ncbi:MAG: DUF4282 domain-containing protein [Deltaproteobacteria bacterium]
MNFARLISALFDTKFSVSITPEAVKILYAGGIASAGLMGIILVIGAFVDSVASGILATAAALPVFLLFAIALRLWCEAKIAIFDVADSLREIAKSSEDSPETPGGLDN